MAVLNELGRNSAAITYGPSTTGADLWPTFATIDKWLRNDTLQGTATASGTTVTGVGTIFGTQLRIGDIIMIAGQKRTVNGITSDISITVDSSFSPAVSVASAIKVLQTATYGTQLVGTASNVVAGYPNATNGVVSVTANSTTVTGVNTYFLSDVTNSVTTTQVTGTVSIDASGNITGVGTTFTQGADGSANKLQPGDSILLGASDYFVVATVTSDTAATVKVAGNVLSSVNIYKANNISGNTGRTIIINGRARQVTAITSNTSLTVNYPFDFTDSNLQMKVLPRGTVATTAGSSSITGTGTNFRWDLPTSASLLSHQVWIGDELRTVTPSSPTAATLTDAIGFSSTTNGAYPVAASGLSFKRDDTYISYTNVAPTVLGDELRVGDDIIINGWETTVTTLISDTQFRVSTDMPVISSATVYKKRKLHGFVLEGTREGNSATPTQTKYSGVGATTYIAGNSIIGSNTITISSAANTTTYAAGNFVKIQNGGGPAVLLTGSVTSVSGGTITGSGTSFTTQLHVGAEVYIAGFYGYVASISSATSMTLTQWGGATVTNATNTSYPIYRTTPLYTYITAVNSTTVTLYHCLANTLVANTTYTTAGPAVLSPLGTGTGGADFIEFIYSAPNKSAEATTALVNRSLDRKYIGFRYFPMNGGSATLITSNAAYNTVVYERWLASSAQAGGVGINKADQSDGTSALNGVTDQTVMTQQQGGFLYLFAKPRYFILQGKSFANVQQQWIGCVEFERAQPEDVGTGSGVTAGAGTAPGYTYYGALSATGIQITPQQSPWPCFAYFNSNRFPVGSQQVPTAPVSFSTLATPVHGGIFAVPRIRSSAGDLVGLNAHIYTAATITTGRWGHLFETGQLGAYSPTITAATSITTGSGVFTTTTANAILQPHLGHLVPQNTNVYNSKRFMFSPVVVLGPAWDPDIRGRIYGLKVIPSALGTLMDTVSVTIETTDDFYAATGGTATDHWVITSSVNTLKVVMPTANWTATSAIRSLEDASPNSSSNSFLFTNNFRFALPA